MGGFWGRGPETRIPPHLRVNDEGKTRRALAEEVEEVKERERERHGLDWAQESGDAARSGRNVEALGWLDHQEVLDEKERGDVGEGLIVHVLAEFEDGDAAVAFRV